MPIGEFAVDIPVVQDWGDEPLLAMNEVDPAQNVRNITGHHVRTNICYDS